MRNSIGRNVSLTKMLHLHFASLFPCKWIPNCIYYFFHQYNVTNDENEMYNFSFVVLDDCFMHNNTQKYLKNISCRIQSTVTVYFVKLTIKLWRSKQWLVFSEYLCMKSFVGFTVDFVSSSTLLFW